MLSYCLKCRKKKTENKISEVLKTINGRIILSSKCSVCYCEKSKFPKEQEATGWLSSLGIRMPLSQIPYWGPLLF